MSESSSSAPSQACIIASFALGVLGLVLATASSPGIRMVALLFGIASIVVGFRAFVNNWRDESAALKWGGAIVGGAAVAAVALPWLLGSL